MTATLGTVPAVVDVALSAGTDFAATLTPAAGSTYPAGLSVELVLDQGTGAPITWTATVTTTAVTFTISETQVDAAIAAKPRRARMYYTVGTVRLLWTQGQVIVK